MANAYGADWYASVAERVNQIAARREGRMKFRFLGKIMILAAVNSAVFGCGNQAALNAPNSEKPNTAAINPNAPKTGAAGSETIKFESAGKVEIVGIFYQSTNANSPAVLLLHQWGSNRRSYEELAKRLQNKGFGVLAIDGRGFGESTRTADRAVIAPARNDAAVSGMKADVDNALNFLAKQKNVDPSRIGIVGASYGSSLAMIYGAENKKVKSVALLSPGLNYFGNMPIENAAKDYGDRYLLMVAAGDDKESAETVRTLKQAAANDKYQMQIYEKGGHGTGLFSARVGLEDLLEEFLIKSLS